MKMNVKIILLFCHFVFKHINKAIIKWLSDDSAHTVSLLFLHFHSFFIKDITHGGGGALYNVYKINNISERKTKGE